MIGENDPKAPEGGAASSSMATPDNERIYAEVLAEILGVSQVEPDKHFFDDLGADSMLMARFCARVRKRSDVPAVSMKDVYKGTTIAGLAAIVAPAQSAPNPQSASTADNERVYAEVLAEILGVSQVEPDKHFFDDLGADSMLMARFCARIRKRSDVPAVSMKDIYKGPTIAGLVAIVAPSQSAANPKPASTADNERVYAEVLAEILGVKHVEPDKHFFDDLGADSMLMARFCARIRKRGDVPKVAMKEVYKAPTIAGLVAIVAPTQSAPDPQPASTANNERVYAEVLAEILGVSHVATDKHFFDDLGADSMLMARFCARIRKRGDVPKVAMKEIYDHPSVASLAAMVSTASAKPKIPQPDTPAEPVKLATNREVAICGVLQLAASLAYLYLIALVLTLGYRWTVEGAGHVEVFARATVFTSGSFALMCLLPILAKWMLVGRWTVRQYRIWSLDYVRFWVAKSLIQSNPLVLFAGTPIYNVYLRALGASVGRSAVIHSPHVPVCTDLLTIGDHAIVRKDSYFNCYRAHAGVIQTGRVSLGKNSFVGEMTVLDIDTSLGDGAQIGHSSALYKGQSIPANERRHGSPAEHQTAVDLRDVPEQECGSARKVIYCLLILLPMLLALPITIAIISALGGLLADRPQFNAAGSTPLLHLELYGDALLVSAALFFGSLITGLVVAGTVPRILNRALEPDKVYRLYGLHYYIHRWISGLTNVQFYTFLFGDSSYIVKYLQWIGYDFPNVVQTGSNFGLNLKQDNPFLVTVGSGTVVADGLSAINADYSSSSFRLSRVTIGRDNFLGNFVAYPARGKVGDNCLLATKVMVPVEGEIREEVGLLGSPSFDIPRSVARDRDLELDNDEELASALATKDKHNLRTIGLFLAVHWFETFMMTCLIFSVARLFGTLDAPVAALLAAVVALFAVVLRIAYHILIERLSTGFQSLKPQECSIYDPYFWFHERYWKMMVGGHLRPLDGTPFKPIAWRLYGMKIGARVFDDGCDVTERTMTTIGDDCTLNMGSIVQPHSQEDGGFKSDYIEIGKGCTIGVGAWVHYGTTLGDGSELAANSFLMKGEEMPAGTIWAENPAREVSGSRFPDNAASRDNALAATAE